MPKVARSAEERFWSHVDRNGPVHPVLSTGCWLWMARRNRGYGRFWKDGRDVFAHRFSWALANGHVPAGMCVLHHCDNPPCVNPAHLFVGTQVDNVRDRDAKHRGRAPHGEASGASKLIEIEVRDIRAAYGQGEAAAALAIRYGVCVANIHYVARGGTWARVDGALPLGDYTRPRPRGERNPSAKLTAAIVAEIRAALAAGSRPLDLATACGVTPQLIRSIRDGKTWTHVPVPAELIDAKRLRPVGRARGERNGSRTYPERRPRGDQHWTILRPNGLARGEQSGNAKPTTDDVQAIRRALIAGERIAALARRYGVSEPTVAAVRDRRTWAHLPPPGT